MLLATVPQSTSRVIRADGKSGRFYHITDPITGEVARYPSVTTILGAAIAKPALIHWAAKEERLATSEAAADLYADLHGAQQLPRPMYLLALEQRVGKVKAHTKVLAKAAEIGSAAHAWVEWSLKTALGVKVGPEPALSDAAMASAVAFDDFQKEVALRPLFIEQIVFSRTHAYAGTLDLVASLDAQALLTRLERQGPVADTLADWLRTRDQVTACIDIKTSKGIWPEHLLQAVAYSRALAEMGHGRVDGGLIVRLPKTETDSRFEVAVVPPARELFPVFLACKQLWAWSFQQEEQRARRAA